MKYADKVGAQFSTVIGDNEIETGKCKLKEMKTGVIKEVEIPTGLVGAVYDSRIDEAMNSLTDCVEGSFMDLKGGKING